MKVFLTYFRPYGKYYSEGEYETNEPLLYKIWEEVKNMEKHPGLSLYWNGIISVDVPDHPNTHPCLIVGRG
jgi:hypothetical protein